MSHICHQCHYCPLYLPLELLEAFFSRCWTRCLDDVEKKFVAIPALPSGSLSHSCVCHTCDKSLYKERIHGILEHNDDSLVEGVGEAAPQLILQQILTIPSDAERKLAPLHLLCLASSCIMVNCARALEGMFKHERSNQDSMLRGRSLLQKLWLIAQISPAFLPPPSILAAQPSSLPFHL